MSIAKIETASGVTLVLNGNTVFASDDTSYWLQGAKVIGDDGHVYSVPGIYKVIQRVRKQKEAMEFCNGL